MAVLTLPGNKEHYEVFSREADVRSGHAGDHLSGVGSGPCIRE